MNPTSDGRSDEELVAIVQADHGGARGHAAADELFGRWRRRVYVWCVRIVRDHERATDLAQEALVSAWRGLPAFDARAKFSSWLFAIVRNRCLSAMRPRILVRDAEADPDWMESGAVDPLDRLAIEEEESAVRDAVREALDPVEQQALWLRAFEGLPVEEITRLLGIEGGSGARGTLQSARRKLRARLAERGKEH
jgi:RNA polymerase sigma-70 factor (ECF subfamily)